MRPLTSPKSIHVDSKTHLVPMGELEGRCVPHLPRLLVLREASHPEGGCAATTRQVNAITLELRFDILQG